MNIKVSYKELRLKRHVKKHGHKNNGYFNYFNKDWFKKHQNALVWLLNHWLLKYWFRRILRIHKDCLFSESIDRIEPHTYRVKIGINEYRSDFRTHQKFSKRIYYAFRPLWWVLHVMDYLIQSTLMPDFSFGFDTLTVYPDANPESTTVDGYLFNNGSAMSTVRNASSGSTKDDSSTYMVSLARYNSNEYQIYRIITYFNTSSIVSGSTLSSAVYSLCPMYDGTSSNGDRVYPVVSSTGIASNTAIALADYAYSKICTTVNIASALMTSLVAGTYSNISIYISYLSNFITKAGITKMGMMAGYDINNTSPTVSDNYACFYTADYTGTSYDPKLVVTYTLPIIYMAGNIASTSTITGKLEKYTRIQSGVSLASNISAKCGANKKVTSAINSQTNSTLEIRNQQKLSAVSRATSNITAKYSGVNKCIGQIEGISNIAGVIGLDNSLSSVITAESAITLITKASKRFQMQAGASSNINAMLRTTKRIDISLNAGTNIYSQLRLNSKIIGNINSTTNINGLVKYAFAALKGYINVISDNYGKVNLIQKLAGNISSETSIVSLLNEYDLLRMRISVYSSITGLLNTEKYYKGNISSYTAITGSLKNTRRLQGIISGISSISLIDRNEVKLLGYCGVVSSLDTLIKVSCGKKGILNTTSKINNLNIVRNSSLVGIINAGNQLELTLELTRKIKGYISGTNNLQSDISLNSRLVSSLSCASSMALALKLKRNLRGQVKSKTDTDLNVALGMNLYSSITGLSHIEVELTKYVSVSGLFSSESRLNSFLRLYMALSGVFDCLSALELDLPVNRKCKGKIEGLSQIYPNLKGPVYLRALITGKTNLNTSKLGLYRPFNGRLNANSELLGIVERKRNFDAVIGKF